MTERLEEALAREFPFMAGIGIDCGDGWYQLIRELCAEVMAVYADSPVDLEVIQVKEKFGTLRLYCHSGDRRVKELVGRYEDRSACICEDCGAPGSLRTDLDWIQTLCDAHYLEKARRRKEKTE